MSRRITVEQRRFVTGRPDLPIGCIDLSLRPQDPRGRPGNCVRINLIAGM